MKKNIFKVSLSMLVLSLVTGFVLSSCSNSEDLADGATPQNGMERVSFTIAEKDYETAVGANGTRTAAQPQTEVQDLGDGWTAEVSLVPDTTHSVAPKVATRAIYGSSHYTIQAYQGGVLKGQTKGTFNNSTFTPDTGDEGYIVLPHGTYDFVCFNDKVSANGTQYSVNRADASTARFAVKRGVVINQDPKQYVAFEMKHVGSMVTFNLAFVNCPITGEYYSVMQPGISYVGWGDYKPEKPAERLKYTIETAPNKIPEKEVYDFSMDNYSYPVMGKEDFSVNVEGRNTAYSYGIFWVGSKLGIYNNATVSYYLPTSDCGDFKLTFTFGEIYGQSLVGKSITVPTHKLVEANKRYNVKIKLRMSKNMYLFKDGTAGFLADNPSKTPIGVVIDPYAHLAVALKDADDGGTLPIWSYSSTQESSSPVESFEHLFSGWGMNYSNISSSNPARELARDYYQTVGFGSSSSTVIGVDKVWYIPTVVEFLKMGNVLGELEYTTPTGDPSHFFAGAPLNILKSINMTRFNKAFTDAGGTPPTNNAYWTNTECKGNGTYYPQVQVSLGSTSCNLRGQFKGVTAKVRPFIKY